MKYETDDLILPTLKLKDPTPIKVEITDKYVILCVGPRDWQWNKETGEMVGAGTALDPPVPFEGEAPPQVIEN